MSGVRYEPDIAGTGQLMRSIEMAALLEFIAEGGADFARSIAPVSDRATDPHRGEYKASFRVETRRRGGPAKDRAEARIVNDSPYAVLVEWYDGHHVLARTAAHLGAISGE